MHRNILIQLGYGKVGKCFEQEILAHNDAHPKQPFYWQEIRNSQGLLPPENRPILIPASTDKVIMTDLTASTKTMPILLEAIQKRQLILLANKNPLVASQAEFEQLLPNLLGFRATVGAGLPVIPEIKRLLQEGQQITRLEACLSGTMGILFSDLQAGRPFSEIIAEAVEKGYSEPDPRIDLGGQDVAKKLLILSRLAGYKLELASITTEKLYPAPMDELEIDDFLKHLKMLDPLFKQKMEQARSQGKTMKYVATMANGKCSVGSRELAHNSPLGELRNDQKRILIYTDKNTKPIIISGQGSGPKDTATDLLKDLKTL